MQFVYDGFLSYGETEDACNYSDVVVKSNAELNEVEVEDDDSNPFIVHKSKIQKLEDTESEKLKADDRFTISTLDIVEEE